MRILLHPPGDSALDAIVMTEELLAVGRRQALFDRFPRSAVAKLSKRHARLFVDGSMLYLVDLGSLNGTFVNGTQLGAEPLALRHGDALTFGDLEFRLEIQEPPAARSSRQLRLVLKPDIGGSALESAVISQFPFLISKNSELFQQLMVADPERHSFLSRKHAQIIRLGERFYLEDLGSTNGTAVNDNPIEEHLTPIHDGDLLSFGDAALSFRAFVVEVSSGAETLVADEETELETLMTGGEPLAAEISEVLESGRTIMVDSATSFIDVYFNGGGSTDGAEAKPAPVPTPKPDTVPRAVLETLVGEGTQLRRWLQGGAVALALGIGVSGIVYWQGADARRLRALSEADDPEAVLTLAAKLLKSQPDDEQLQLTALKALQQARLPDWYNSFAERDLERARYQLAEADAAGAANAADDELLVLLRWATDVRGFLDGRDSSAQNSADPFAEAQQATALLEYWTSETRLRMRLLRDLEDSSPKLDGVAEAVVIDVRRLRAFELDTEPLRRLAAELAGQLARGNAAEVERLLGAAIEELRLPQARQQLKTELLNYQEVERAIAAERWLAARERVAESPFATQIFASYGEQLRAQRLPNDAFVQSYERAIEAWRSGDVVLSRTYLEGLLETPWAVVAQRQLDQQDELLAGAWRLEQQEGQRGYPRALFDFYAELDPVRDQALVEQLRPAFQRYSTEALAEASASLADAERRWRRYNTLGRIQTEHRLAAEVNREFEVLAGLLKESQVAFERGLAIYRQLAREPSSNWQALQDSLDQELKVQRSALRNLQVLAPTVRERKLALLGDESAGSGRG